MGAAEEGADYVWFCAAAAGAETLSAWAEAMVVPCIVGGGIDARNAASWASTGAEFLAVGRAVWASSDPAVALRRIAAALG
jgi:thiamine-phosphate pyrophosphorylase